MRQKKSRRQLRIILQNNQVFRITYQEPASVGSCFTYRERKDIQNENKEKRFQIWKLCISDSGGCDLPFSYCCAGILFLIYQLIQVEWCIRESICRSE